MINITDLKTSIEVQDFTVFKKYSIFWIWLYMQFVSNPLFFGIVQFERKGGDPLKRRVTDQVSLAEIH